MTPIDAFSFLLEFINKPDVFASIRISEKHLVIDIDTEDIVFIWQIDRESGKAFLLDIHHDDFPKEISLEDMSNEEIITLIKKIITPVIVETPTYEISYQEEAFPWDMWSIKETYPGQTRGHELNTVYVGNDSGIVQYLYTFIQAEGKHDARNKGGKLILEYLGRED